MMIFCLDFSNHTVRRYDLHSGPAGRGRSMDNKPKPYGVIHENLRQITCALYMDNS